MDPRSRRHLLKEGVQCMFVCQGSAPGPRGACVGAGPGAPMATVHVALCTGPDAGNRAENRPGSCDAGIKVQETSTRQVLRGGRRGRTQPCTERHMHPLQQCTHTPVRAHTHVHMQPRPDVHPASAQAPTQPPTCISKRTHTHARTRIRTAVRTHAPPIAHVQPHPKPTSPRRGMQTFVPMHSCTPTSPRPPHNLTRTCTTALGHTLTTHREHHY